MGETEIKGGGSRTGRLDYFPRKRDNRGGGPSVLSVGVFTSPYSTLQSCC